MKHSDSCENLIAEINQGAKKVSGEYFKITAQYMNQLAKAIKSSKSLKNFDIHHCSTSDDTSFKVLAEAIKCNTSLKNISIRLSKIDDYCGVELAQALSKNPALEIINLHGNFLGNCTAFIIASSIKNNICLKALYLGGGGNIDALGASALDEAITANSNIVYADYHYQSKSVKNELGQRQKYVKDLIVKWRKNDPNTLKIQELMEFYNNIHYITYHAKYESDGTTSYLIYSKSFKQKLRDRLYCSVFNILEALNQNLPIEVSKSILSYCVNKSAGYNPINICENLGKTSV